MNNRIIFNVLMFLLGSAITAALFLIMSPIPKPDALPMRTSVSFEVYSDDSGKTDTANSGQQLVSLAYEIAGCLQRRDYAALSTYAHPEYGVVFSPFSTVSLASDKCFTAGEIFRFKKDDTKYIWGVYSSGKPIELTPADYFDDFVYDASYVFPDAVGIDYIVRSGNALENVSETFPDAHYVDLYVNGTNDTDWKTLRLVFEDYDGQWYLTAIIHSAYTV